MKKGHSAGHSEGDKSAIHTIPMRLQHECVAPDRCQLLAFLAVKQQLGHFRHLRKCLLLLHHVGQPILSLHDLA